MKGKQNLWIIASLAVIASCSPGRQDENSGSQAPGVRVVKEFYPDGRLKSETEAIGKLRHGVSKEYRQNGTLENMITYENNRKHGPALNYYSDGETVKTQIDYVDGYKQGEARWYYPDGKIYRITPYVKGKIHGTRRTYYESGTLQAEIPYQSGQPGMGLKEYYPDGNPKNPDARIVFSEQDRISMDNTFVLSIKISDGSRNVGFFEGKLTDGKYWNEQMSPIETANGVGVMEFFVSKGSFKMETLNIVARIKTNLDNYLIIQREYHLALENKF
jgi:antitoxin component YwqK of YwqJK toxin-antitoxin module